MAEGNATLYFLLIRELPTDGVGRDTARRLALADVGRLHESGHRVDAILVLGGSGGDLASEELVFQLQDACDAWDYQPHVVPVPGLGDRTLPASRLLARSLTEDWGRDGPDLWAGNLTEDVVTPLETKVFADFMRWHRQATGSITGWRRGLLPGDGSVRLDAGGRTVGLVSLNTVFRMVTEVIELDTAQCFSEQLDQAVGGDFADWTRDNDLTLLATGRSGALPDLPPESAPLVRVAGGGSRADRWEVASGDGSHHQLLVAKIGVGRAEVTDVSERRRIGASLPQAASAVQPMHPAAEPEEPYDGTAVLNAFQQNLSTGRMALVLVSGPEPSPPITLDELHLRLAEALYPEVHTVLSYPLRETWAAARSLSEQVRARILDELRAPAGDVAATVHRLLRAPWHRVYDFTGTDLFSRARSKNPAGVSLVNACEENPGDKREALEVVMMHGLPLEGSAPPDFGDTDELPRGHPRRSWANRFRAELLERPALFISLTADSPALWDALRAADRHVDRAGYPTFLVGPEGTLTARARLRATGLQHIRMEPSNFVATQLAPGGISYQQGRQLLSRAHESTVQGVGVERVDQLLAGARDGDSTFLRGRDPHWGDIKAKQLAPRLSLFDEVLERTAPSAEGRLPIVLVKGSAGTGKTTTLMQVAHHLHQKHAWHVGWVDRGTQISSFAVANQVQQQNLGAVFVDDIDLFKSSASDFMRRLNDNGRRLVIASIRSSRYNEIPAGFPAEIVNLNREITDGDLKKLIKALDKNTLISDLKGLSRSARLDELKRMSEKGLLAAMIKAVTGSTLREKVISEYDELAKYGFEFQWAYAVVCIFNSETVFRSKDISSTSLLEILSYPDAPTHRDRLAVEGLKEMGLLITTTGQMLRSRQRTLADEVVTSALANRPSDLEIVMLKLLSAYAEKARFIKDDKHPDRRTMIRLLNHSVLGGLFGDPAAARRTYQAAHDLLHDDRHYWLQRAEFEIDNSDFPTAFSYVQAGQGCEGGENDRYLRTCSARLRLKWSAANPTDRSLLEEACNAVEVLHKLVRGPQGRDTPHAFVALANDGARWLLKCSKSLGYQRYTDFLDLIRDDVSHRELYQGRNDVEAAARRFAGQLVTLEECVPGLRL
ncbi:ATP-binding protein [Streptomyces sp. NPDC033538]|uniref:ATP-binding protein n=1 Tax=Streptomyces sp. NPDC033538 TaxID=3155367 RepID=UPI0033C352BE